MAWERSFEKRILKIRDKELKFQKLNYTIEVLWLIFLVHFCLTSAYRFSGILPGRYSSNQVDSQYSKISL